MRIARRDNLEWIWLALRLCGEVEEVEIDEVGVIRRAEHHQRSLVDSSNLFVSCGRLKTLTGRE